MSGDKTIAETLVLEEPKHGTHAAYVRHVRTGTTPCGECRRAAADYQRERRRRDPVARSRDRWFINTRVMALREFAAGDRDGFAVVLADVRARNPWVKKPEPVSGGGS